MLLNVLLFIYKLIYRSIYIYELYSIYNINIVHHITHCISVQSKPNTNSIFVYARCIGVLRKTIISNTEF